MFGHYLILNYENLNYNRKGERGVSQQTKLQITLLLGTLTFELEGV